MIPLSIAKPGETSYIKKITGKDGVRQHLAEMGFVVGSKMLKGPALLLIKRWQTVL